MHAPEPVIREQREISLTGVMAVYEDQNEASAKIPEQWRAFLALPIPSIKNATTVYGASPCTGDHRIHYLCGVEGTFTGEGLQLQKIVLPAGEYATFAAGEDGNRGELWSWILRDWLPASDYREAPSPEFERFPKQEGASETGLPITLGVPLERKAKNTTERG